MKAIIAFIAFAAAFGAQAEEKVTVVKIYEQYVSNDKKGPEILSTQEEIASSDSLALPQVKGQPQLALCFEGNVAEAGGILISMVLLSENLTFVNLEYDIDTESVGDPEMIVNFSYQVDGEKAPRTFPKVRDCKRQTKPELKK